MKRLSKNVWTPLALVVAIGGGSLANAQTVETNLDSAAAPNATEKKEAPSTKKVTWGPLIVSGNWRARGEGWDWFEDGNGDSNYGYGHSLFRVAIGQQGERLEWRLESAQDTIFALPDNAVAPAPQGQLGFGGAYFAANGNTVNSFNGFVREAFVRFKKLGNGNLQIGRFEFQDGTEVIPADVTLASLVRTRVAQRLVGNAGWSAVGRSFDGAQFSYNFGKNNLTFMGARPTRGVYQVDSMGELDIGVFSGSFTMPFGNVQHPGEVRVFGMGYIDGRASVLKSDNRPQAVRAADHGSISIASYGLDYLQVFNTRKSGKFDVLLWEVLQAGSWGVQSHSAGAFFGEFGWQPPENRIKPWISAGYSYSSGDNNPYDSHHGTFFQMIPTARAYAQFPFYNMMNNEDLYATLVLRPTSKLSLRSELHSLKLSSSSDLWYAGTGPYQPKTFGYTGRPSGGNSSLATVADVSADYKFTRSFGVNFYYARAWGKTVVAKIYPGESEGQLAYAETILRF
ncbi:MAG TPA: alginate export family protein [Candidatus Acidoferrum sp.]